jgi:hypothetical protein
MAIAGKAVIPPGGEIFSSARMPVMAGGTFGGCLLKMLPGSANEDAHDIPKLPAFGFIEAERISATDELFVVVRDKFLYQHIQTTDMQTPSVIPKCHPMAKRTRSRWRRRVTGRTTLTAGASHTIKARGTLGVRLQTPTGILVLNFSVMDDCFLIS